MDTNIMFSSKTDDWSTPQEFFNELNLEFGFTLDPCADDYNHKCEKYFTKEMNGLSQSWDGERVFCNPPYGREIGDWVRKCYLHGKSGNGIAVMLIPARTDTKWFHEYIYRKENVEVRFLKGRLKFGGSKKSAPFPSMVVIFKGNGDYIEHDSCKDCKYVKRTNADRIREMTNEELADFLRQIDLYFDRDAQTWLIHLMGDEIDCRNTCIRKWLESECDVE